jgi:hypothetical protein
MLARRSHSRIGKATALAAAALTLPILAYASPGPISLPIPIPPLRPIPIVPEVNPLWVLIPVAVAAMLFSARQFARRKV